MARHTQYDLGHVDLTSDQATMLAQLFHWTAPANITAQPLSVTQSYYKASWPYYFVLLISPLICVIALFRGRPSVALLLFVHSTLFVVIASLFATAPSVRYLQPVSLCFLLSVALLFSARPLNAAIPAGAGR
jgi:hypothetical protein